MFAWVIPENRICAVYLKKTGALWWRGMKTDIEKFWYLKNHIKEYDAAFLPQRLEYDRSDIKIMY